MTDSQQKRYLTGCLNFLKCRLLQTKWRFFYFPRRVAAGLSFTLVYSALLVKTVRISLIFNTLGKRLDRDFKRLLRPAPQVTNFDFETFVT